MTKILPLVIAMLAFCAKECYGNLSSMSLEARGAVFLPSSSKYRHIYGSTENTWGGELAIGDWKSCQLWVNGDYLSEGGHSIGMKCQTHIDIATASFGIKKNWTVLPCIDLYAGLGCCFGHVWLKNRGICVREKVKKNSWGVVVKTGARQFIANNFYIGLFADYSYQPVHFQRTVDVGGWKLGLAIGKALDF
jgi:hypothetical protein